MKTQDLTEYIFSSVLKDSVETPLWGVPLILLYLKEAQELFCRKTHILSKSVGLSVVALENMVPLPAGILKVYHAELDTVPLRHVVGIESSAANGTPYCFSTDNLSGMIKLYPTPVSSGALSLRVAALPTSAPSLYPEVELEIPEEYHLALGDWVAYRCLMTEDVDGKSSEGAAQYRRQWDETISLAKRQLFNHRIFHQARVVNREF
jgi:hypothetical protein